MDEAKRRELIQTLGQRLNQAVRLYLDNCTRCGVCIESCHVYASEPDTVKYFSYKRRMFCARPTGE